MKRIEDVLALGAIVAATACRHGAAPAPVEESVLTIASSLPCDSVTVEGEPVTEPLPTTRRLPPGRYRGVCINQQYEIATFASAELRADADATLAFSWAIVVNRLEPAGRVSIENPSDPSVTMDLGISSSEIGVPVPDDGRALKLILRDLEGNEIATRSIVLEAGKTYDISW